MQKVHSTVHFLVNGFFCLLQLDAFPIATSLTLSPLTASHSIFATSSTRCGVIDKFLFEKKRGRFGFRKTFFKMSSDSFDRQNADNKRGDKDENAVEPQPLMSWNTEEDPVEDDDILLDDYCAVMDDFGCEAYEELAKNLDEKVFRWIRVEAWPDESIKNVSTRKDILHKIEEVRSYQMKFGPSDLYERHWNERLRTCETKGCVNGDGEPREHSFSVLQFNVLAEGLSSGPDAKTPFPVDASDGNNDNNDESPKNSFGGFSQVPFPEICLDFSLRRWRLLEVILGLPCIGSGRSESSGADIVPGIVEGAFDILALEEVDRFRGFFAPLLRIFGYEGIFMPKTKSPSVRLGFYSDGCALFWKTTTFALVSEERYQFTVGNQVMILAALRHLESGIPVLVAVTHLKAQKSGSNEMIRCKQVDELLDHIQDTAEKLAVEEGLEKVRVIIAGDFNADPPPEVTGTESSIGRVLSNHIRSRKMADTKSEPVSATSLERLRFQSVYEVDPPSDSFFTTWKTRGTDTVKRVIDYIFYSDSLSCTATLNVPTAAQLEIGLLPGLRYPSDHLMIAAKFEIRQ